MFCEKCGTEYEGSSCPKCQEDYNNKFKNLFVDPNESVEGVLGNNAVQTFFSTGVLGNGFAVLSNKRMYFKGKCYVRAGKGFIKKVEERIVDLGDITGTGFVHNKNLILQWLFYIFTCVGVFGYMIPLPFWIVYFNTNKKWAFNTALVLSGPLSWLFYFLNNMFNYSLFEVSYAGGGIGFDLHWISNSEAHDFQKLLQAAKGKLKEERPVYTNHKYENSNDIPEQLKKYKDLLDSGIITVEEFEAKKKQLLGL